MNIQELMEKRKKLCDDRDKLYNAYQMNIVSLWKQIQAKFLQELIDLGIFKEKWVYYEDTMFNSQTRKEILFLGNIDLATKACDLANKYNYQFYLDDPILTFRTNSVQISFSNKTNPIDIIKKYNITVDFTQLNEKIQSLNEVKKVFGY